MKVAIFGVWHVHAPDYTRRALAMGEVIGFFERDESLARSFAEQFDIPRFATAEELLASDAESVIVCSASKDHAEDIIRIANSGKNIFTEKVLALTNEECDRIEEAIAANRVKLVISMFQKYLASRMAVKQTVRSGELGKINLVRFRNCHNGSTGDWLPRHFYSQNECGGGAMIDLGAHGMYLIHDLLGLPESAASAFTVCCGRESVRAKNTDGVEDNAVTVMKYADGAIAINETGFVYGASHVVFEAHGERGYVRMDNNRVVKCTEETGRVEVEVPLGDSLPLPIEQFLTGNILEGCSIAEAKALTAMMVMAYSSAI